MSDLATTNKKLCLVQFGDGGIGHIFVAPAHMLVKRGQTVICDVFEWSNPQVGTVLECSAESDYDVISKFIVAAKANAIEGVITGIVFSFDENHRLLPLTACLDCRKHYEGGCSGRGGKMYCEEAERVPDEPTEYDAWKEEVDRENEERLKAEAEEKEYEREAGK